MKSCPTCNRTFADDSITFCLVDGSILSAPYDPQATLIIPDARSANPAVTEVLPKKDLPETIVAPPTVAPSHNAAPQVRTDSGQITARPSEIKKGIRQVLKVSFWGIIIGMILGTIIRYVGLVQWYRYPPNDFFSAEIIIFGTLVGGLIGAFVIPIIWAITKWLRDN